MITKSLPNMFTLGNLVLGVIAIIFAFNGQPALAAILVIVAMLTDGLDGRVARALNAQSDFGKELDSLCDIISFGVAPAFIMYVAAFQDLSPALAWTVTALFAVCGALRLARFNVTNTGNSHFIGLPIPAAGSVLSTMALFHDSVSTSLLVASEIILSYLMVSNVRYPSFKKIGIPKAAVWVTPLIVIVAIVLAVWFPSQLSKMLFIPLALYALFGLRKNIRYTVRRIRRARRRHLREKEEMKMLK